ncbi:MAG: hypothetical protein ACTSRI_10800 [Promethearchaeota archaeon]
MWSIAETHVDNWATIRSSSWAPTQAPTQAAFMCHFICLIKLIKNKYKI